MGDDKNNGLDPNIEAQLRTARATRGGLDARKALNILADKLKLSPGFYTWAPLGGGSEAVWQLRIPRPDRSDAAWLKTEVAELLHICQPLKFLEAVETRNKDALANFCGYVRDADEKNSDKETFKCVRCKRKMPLSSAKKGYLQLKLHRLGKVV
jgi:hypothetical protein